VRSEFNHTVVLLQEIQITCGYIVALPLLQPLPRCTPENEESVISLTRQFLEAVSFMHRYSVAHLDLKPDNILVNIDGPPQRLWITDFSVSVFVGNEDEMIEGYTGTPGWTAPEVGDVDGPPQTYSPIRADRWSCGRMVQHFKTFGPGFNEPGLESLSSYLLNVDPVLRPSLITHLPQAWNHS
jgi:serine/threonine protein kinase